MRQRCALLLGLWTVSLAGCLSGQTVHTTAWLDRLRPFHGPSGADAVQMVVAVVECPVGDGYINQELWSLVDEQVIAPEHKAPVEDNGFRVGQIGGLLPAGLQKLLTSERTCQMRCQQTHAGNATPILLGPVTPWCRFELHQDGRPTPVEVKDAQCLLEVVPSLTADGRTRLHFTPKIQHGAKRMLPFPAGDRSGWVLQDQRPTEDYTALAWDVTLTPNQYVVIGTRYDCPGTLGYQCFLQTEGHRPVQRLLVISTGRLPGVSELATNPATGEADPAFSRAPPLALRAAWTTARGSEH